MTPKEKEPITLEEALGRVVKALGRYIVKYPLLSIVAVLIILWGLTVKAKGDKFNIGGLLARLFDMTPNTEEQEITLVNSVPEKRVDEAGKPIPVGEPDKHGFVQWQQTEIVPDTNPLRDTEKIKVQDETGKQVAIQLPKGVEDRDVETVIQVKPKAYVVKVKNTSNIDLNALKNIAGSLP